MHWSWLRLQAVLMTVYSCEISLFLLRPEVWVTKGLGSEAEGKHEMEQTTQWSLKNFCKAHDAMHMIQIKHLW